MRATIDLPSGIVINHVDSSTEWWQGLVPTWSLIQTQDCHDGRNTTNPVPEGLKVVEVLPPAATGSHSRAIHRRSSEGEVMSAERCHTGPCCCHHVAPPEAGTRFTKIGTIMAGGHLPGGPAPNNPGQTR